MTPFHLALAHTLAAEGYYTDSGPTYRGIDRRYWPGLEGIRAEELLHCQGYMDFF